ncbi:caspase family protein [Bradyrhizobium symbiodeficiens]|uniref:Caspase family protein n=1 Tax=Bradyrhizobium symbiodeficiens TaxID=1404367 RepID=A0A6G8ZY91_9BRAD|nr:caspase family protein [Bradyrhizobium symbiodeficiens]
MIKRVMHMVAAIGGAAIMMVLVCNAARAERRVALVVGNGSYQSVPKLSNPARDAASVAKMFHDAGFETVEVQVNVGNLEFKRAIRKFETVADQSDIAIVYYAGHGLEIGGVNYLIPVDARLASDRDAEDEAIPLERLVSSADGARRLRLIILDACRDNPFVTTMRRERKAASRGVNAGLGRVEPTATDTLIAYAARAGSTADDGDGEHSPFTTAVLKNLTIPGLDVRLAFGRVRDEVLKITGHRQEPFVYGSLGGGSISLVPAPVTPQDTPVNEVKADFELVQKIGTKRAWEVFLASHPTGFHADLARGEIERLNHPVPAAPSGMVLTALPQPPSPGRETPTREALEWDKLKDSTDIGALGRFVKRFPDSPLAVTAQQRIDVLQKAERERAEQARAVQEAARKAAEEALRQAEQRKAEALAVRKREEEERRAREAEAAAKARAAAAEAEASRKRAEDERRVKALDEQQKAKTAEAERKEAAARLKAEQAERDKAVADAAAARAIAEKQARQADEARKAAEEAATREATCKTEQAKLDDITSRGSEGTGLDQLTVFSRALTCERLSGLVATTLDKFKAEATRRAASAPNSPELVRAAQAELLRLGCLSTKIDGVLTPATGDAIRRYLTIQGQPSETISVTGEFVGELAKRATRVCPLQCKSGEALENDVCVAADKVKPAEEANTGARTRPNKRQADREDRRAKPAATATPRARQQATARPSIVSGGGGSHAIIGVGF